jgi:hypothetical protein
MNRIIILLLSSILLQACAAVGDSKKSISLEKSLVYYESAMRWGDFSAANSLRRYEGETIPDTDPARLKRIRVTGYDVISTIPSDDESTVYITVKISYYDEDDLKLTMLTDKQVWHFDDTEKSWYISSALPAFK